MEVVAKDKYMKKGGVILLWYFSSMILIVSHVGMSLGASLVPICPVCGGEMAPHLRADERFIENAAWQERSAAYLQWVNASAGGALALLEIGVGYNTPGIIRYPFERLAYARPGVTLIRVNRDAPQGVPENRDKTIAFAEDAKVVIEALAR